MRLPNAACSVRFQIEILALRAVALEAQGQAGAALAALQQALDLARPGGFIRVFVDLGRPCRPCCSVLAPRLRRRDGAPHPGRVPRTNRRTGAPNPQTAGKPGSSNPSPVREPKSWRFWASA